MVFGKDSTSQTDVVVEAVFGKAHEGSVLLDLVSALLVDCVCG